ncbi:MAG: glycoside hydrolase family protein [Alphaproteobacteria bacterium]|nr:glycoside hydrolase family protein [Alphaproteobacteria bacterium]
MKIPKFLRDLLQSNNYWNKDSAEFAKANEYLEKLFPGELKRDATGQYIEPKYDMTYEQFLDAQKKFDEDIENAIQEVEKEIEKKTGKVVDCSEFVEIEEKIDVRVLMSWGDIENKKLFVYTLNIPDADDYDDETTNVKKIWVWHSENDEYICDDCASHNGKIFENKNDIPEIPVHPNCRCWVEEVKLDDNGKPISSKAYKGQKPETKTDKNGVQNMKMSDNGINMLKRLEGCVKIGNRHVIYDDKTGKPVDVNKPLPSGATIGYGHLIKPNEDFRNGISESKATELLRADITNAERAVRDNITVPLSQNQFDALTSLAYNIGSKNFADSSVVKYINNPNFHSSGYPNLESAWKTWNKSGGHVMTGLSNRRNQEWNMFNN